MNEEIKEILDRLNNIPMGELYACCLEDSECKLLLDYITNLQEENEILKLDVITTEKNYNNFKDMYEKHIKEDFNYAINYQDYKSRCEKAIEFIKEEAGYDEEIRSCCCDLLYSDCDKLIELLVGDEKQ